MPKCIVCSTETPVTAFLLLREYRFDQGRYWYFCSPDHLVEWLKDQEDIAQLGEGGIKLLTFDWEKQRSLEDAN